MHRVLAELHFQIASTSHRLPDDGASYEFRMVIRTLDRASIPRLAERLCAWDAVREFELGQAPE